MRILGYIEHDYIKITVFGDNNKIILQCEDGLVQLSYKFRQSDIINDLESLKAVMDDVLLKNIEDQLKTMQEVKKQALIRRQQVIEDEFDTII